MRTQWVNDEGEKLRIRGFSSPASLESQFPLKEMLDSPSLPVRIADTIYIVSPGMVISRYYALMVIESINN
jgi:hypothetical protein